MADRVRDLPMVTIRLTAAERKLLHKAAAVADPDGSQSFQEWSRAVLLAEAQRVLPDGKTCPRHRQAGNNPAFADSCPNEPNQLRR